MLITPGQTSDFVSAPELLTNIEGTIYVLGDRGYDSAQIRERIRGQKSAPVIPSKSNSKSPADYDKYIYKERHVVECFFLKLKYFRRIFSRFDKSMRNLLRFYRLLELAYGCDENSTEPNHHCINYHSNSSKR